MVEGASLARLFHSQATEIEEIEIEADLMFIVGKICEDVAKECFEVIMHNCILTLLLDVNYFDKKLYQKCLTMKLSRRKKWPYSELFWSVFSHIRTEYGEILRISPYSVRMRENVDQNNSEYGHFSRSV